MPIAESGALRLVKPSISAWAKANIHHRLMDKAKKKIIPDRSAAKKRTRKPKKKSS
jgi:hypothetical protein